MFFQLFTHFRGKRIFFYANHAFFRLTFFSLIFFYYYTWKVVNGKDFSCMLFIYIGQIVEGGVYLCFFFSASILPSFLFVSFIFLSWTWENVIYFAFKFKITVEICLHLVIDGYGKIRFYELYIRLIRYNKRMGWQIKTYIQFFASTNTYL